MFAGAPGTGKTMTARHLAGRLERPLARVDLASLTSKWVGETEKNLKEVLERAEVAGAILFFDEGDALFAKRGEVERGSDRYANLEVSYLLQALELHDGIAIVTTNQPGAVDEAFLRRFDLIVEFPEPDRQAREALWRRELGAGVGDELDPWIVRFAAEDVSGGHIAAAAHVARGAAGDGDLTPADVALALALELQKLGRTIEAARWRYRAR